MFRFFQKKPTAIATVHPSTVYRNKESGFGVFVCAISRPKSRSFIQNLNSPTKTSFVLGDIVSDKIESFMDENNTNQYYHKTQDFSNVIVMFKTNNVHDQKIHYMSLINFLDRYEEVIGYTDNGDMMTESMINIV